MMQAHLTLLPLFLALLLNLQPTSSEPCTSSFTSSLLSRTNYYRKFHHSPPLALNASLSARAQAWADQLLASGSQAARHRPNRRLSENLFLKITDSGVQLSAEVVVDSWYAGSQLYGQFYGSEPNLADFSSWRYFTAMIWAASRQVGIGCSTEILLDSGKRITYVVANYSPRGNVVGGFKENVRRPKRKVEVYQTTSYNRTSTVKNSTAKTPSYSSTKATTSRKPYKKPASTRPTSTTTTTTAKPSSTTTTTTKKYPPTSTTKSTTARTTRKAPASYSTTKSTKTNKPTTTKTNKPTTTKVYPKTTRKTSTSATKYTSASKRTTTTTTTTSTTTPPAPTIFYQPSYSNQNNPYSNPNFYHHHRPQYYRPRPRPPPPPPSSSSIFSHEDLLDLHEAANHKWPPSRTKPVFYLPPGYQNSKQPLPARPSSFPFKPLPLSSFLSPNLPNFHHYPPSPHQKHVFRPSFYRPVYKPVKFYKNTQNNPVVNDYNNNNSVRRSVNTNSKQKQ